MWRRTLKLGLPRPLAMGVLATGPVAVLGALPRGRLRAYAVFLAQMWAYLRAFELTYADPEPEARLDTGARPR